MKPSTADPMPHGRAVWLLSWMVGLLGFLAACASPPEQPMPVTRLLHDELFAKTAQRFDSASLFALSPPMLDYARTRLPEPSARKDLRQALLHALYSEQGLRLHYDAQRTRNAAEAFAERSGNCLSLVIMTAAFAKHLGQPVSYRSVSVDDLYSRDGNLTLASGHVNLVLGPPPSRLLRQTDASEALTVDFLPANELRGQRSTPLQEQTVVAMYLNNRAAEELSLDRLDAAYGWAREALLQDPQFVSAANTLAVVYQRGGHLQAAEAAWRHALAAAPDHVASLSNLVALLARTGRDTEAAPLRARLLELQPVPPFHHFHLGREALARGDAGAAREHFARELRLQPYQDEVHFWVAQAEFRLGNAARAAEHLRLAREHSNTPGQQARYAAKLDWLRAHRMQ